MFGLYALAGKVGLSLASVHSSASAVWPPTGIALATLLTLGYRGWPAIFAGAFVVNITTAGSLATSLGIAAGNTLEGLVGAYLVNRFAGGARVFDRAPDVFKFAGLAALMSTTISATVGVGTLTLGGYAAWADFSPIWFTWWLGDAAGALIFSPLMVLWVSGGRSYAPRADLLEAAALWLSTILAGLAVFGEGLAHFGIMTLPLTFLCTPPLVWAAVRFRQREAATLVGVLSGIAIWETLHGSGPFVGIRPEVLPRGPDLFTHSERRLDRAPAGLGLGLNLVQRLVELHGGRMQAFSEGPGLGSKFLVRLPRIEPLRTAVG